ncbi:30S ribosomal protein S12 methylthiotransferase RimO [Deltaproteobacteria bacterium TL4]
MSNNNPSRSQGSAQKKVYIETLGCAKNRVDSEVMLASLHSGGYHLTLDPEQAEVIIINTCAFLTEASEESIARILELSDYKTKGCCEKMVATGCLSQRYQDSLLQEIPEIDGLLGSSDFEKIVFLLDHLYAFEGSPASFINRKPHYQQFEKQARIQTTAQHFAYLKVAEGCSHMCSFCNIPYLRGMFSSRSITSVVSEVEELVQKGVKELNIISQDTSSYGQDLGEDVNLTSLLKNISLVQGDFWVRLFYCYPNSFSEEALKVMADDQRFCRYLDMPFQHISGKVLKSMNRKITTQQIRKKMELVEVYLPNVAWRTTFIVGFPTETEENFEELFDFVKEGHFHHVGVFTYSHEDNIRSAKWGDPVPNALKRERKQRLMTLQQEISLQKNQAYIGKTLKVLVGGVSQESDLLLEGRCEFQGPEEDGVIYLNEGEGKPGSFQQVEVMEAHPYDLVGRIVE